VRRWLVLVLLIACGRPVAPTPDPLAADLGQAERMLELLADPTSSARLDAVLAEPGTQLIIAQQNLSRRISVAQYRQTLAAIAGEEAPAFTPVDDSERAARGARGLRDDVWPALHWAFAHRELLAERLSQLRARSLGPAATKLAARWLPDARAPHVIVHVVMGGRAGAAAIGHDIYFDVLATSFKASVGERPYPRDTEIVDFFAHETHHVGVAALAVTLRRNLVLDEVDGRAFDLLALLVSEGSATYLISAHHDLDEMRRDPQYADHLRDPAALLATIEHLLGDALSAADYERALTPLVASGFHSAGALLMATVYERGGRPAVMRVLRDPRRLLAESDADRAGHRFARALVARMAQLGERATAPGSRY
jgi:hypothetical protein